MCKQSKLNIWCKHGEGSKKNFKSALHDTQALCSREENLPGSIKEKNDAFFFISSAPKCMHASHVGGRACLGCPHSNNVRSRSTSTPSGSPRAKDELDSHVTLTIPSPNSKKMCGLHPERCEDKKTIDISRSAQDNLHIRRSHVHGWFLRPTPQTAKAKKDSTLKDISCMNIIHSLNSLTALPLCFVHKRLRKAPPILSEDTVPKLAERPVRNEVDVYHHLLNGPFCHDSLIDLL